jgi:hypothetical protein
MGSSYRARRTYDDDTSPAPAHNVVEEHEEVTESYAGTTASTLSYYESLPARVSAVLTALMLALEGLLALRFVLAAFGANPNSGFVDFVRDVSWPFVRPFDGAFANRTWDEGIIEVSTLLAMGVWFLVFALIMLLVNALMPRFYSDDVRVARRHVTHS